MNGAALPAVHAGKLTLRGVSLGGVYTSIHVPELDLLLDAGIPLRQAAGVGTLLLSHAHADHVGALVTMLGLRGLHGLKKPLRVIMPAEIVPTLERALAAMSELQRWPLAIEAIGLEPGDEHELRRDLVVRAVRTFHPVPSLAYLIVRRVQKLRPEHAGLTGPEIAARRHAGEDLFTTAEHHELAYATDTLVQAIDHAPELAEAQVLVLESTFLDGRKRLEDARAGCHVHLDELIARAPSITTPQLVLMHVSQLYRADEVEPILDARLPAELRARTQVLLPPA
ncbi:MAG TPA: MBL fold metallo-hydrolase [Kofleriaceae bacterium]|nr:MBL fold metallo-hydrolase [Kofleriaceae bacterium]